MTCARGFWSDRDVQLYLSVVGGLRQMSVFGGAERVKLEEDMAFA